MSASVQFDIDAAIAKLSELASEHGPQAVELAVQVVRVNAINNLVQGLVWAVFALAMVPGFRWTRRGYRKSVASEDFNEPIWIMGSGLFCLVGAFCSLGVALTWADVWSWVALFNPKLALAHEVLSRLTGV